MSRSVGVTPFPDPADRLARLEAKRDRKMARSAHAYVRGSTAQFYAWLGEIATLDDQQGLYLSLQGSY